MGAVYGTAGFLNQLATLARAERMLIPDPPNSPPRSSAAHAMTRFRVLSPESKRWYAQYPHPPPRPQRSWSTPQSPRPVRGRGSQDLAGLRESSERIL